MPITLPYAFSNGQIADATQVNANFNALATGTADRVETLQIEVSTPVIASPAAAAGSDPFTITSLALTAGDWDLRGVIGYAITVTVATPWTAKFQAYFDTVPNGWGTDWAGAMYFNAPSNPLSQSGIRIPTHIRRLQLTIPTTYYLTAYAWVRRNDTDANICSEMSATGIFTARRFGT